MTLYEAIREKRKALGLTQLDLAYKMGYKTAAVISKTENGTRPMTRAELRAFAEALGTTPEDLLAEAAGLVDTPVAEPEEEEAEVPAAAPAEVPHTETRVAVSRRPSALAVISFILSLVMLFGLVAGTVYFGLTLRDLKVARSETVYIKTSDTPAADHSAEDASGIDVAALSADVMPTVVYIETKTGSGSGVFMSETGWVMTCAHVIEGTEKASDITVLTNDNETFNATEFYFDTSSDIGVVKIEGTFEAATFGKSSSLVTGEPVVAIGSPLGKDFFQTVTDGIVSSMRHNFEFTSLGKILNVIQHTSPINEGNSGGPLFNRYGEVVGINSIKMSSQYENMNFAIESEDAIRVANDLIKYGKVDRPMIGITGSSAYVNSEGVTVAALTAGGSAETAGVEIDDIITYVNDLRVRTVSRLIAYLENNTKPGDTVTLTVLRGDKEIKIDVLLKSSLELDY